MQSEVNRIEESEFPEDEEYEESEFNRVENQSQIDEY